MPFIEVAGRRIHFADTEGEGVPAILVHSGGLSSRQWSRLTARLAPTYRVVAVDLLGAGKSEGLAEDHPFDFTMDADVVDAVRAHVGGSVHLIGHSYGGLLALTSARRAPSTVRSLALFEPVAFGVLFSTDAVDGQRDLLDYDHDGTFFDDALGGKEPWMERFIDWWQGPGAWQGLPESSRAAFRQNGRKTFQEVRSLTADRTPHTAYQQIRAPALLMTASRSPLAARRVAEQLAATLPAGSLRVLEDAGHMAPLTHGHTVNEAIEAHLIEADRIWDRSR